MNLRHYIIIAVLAVAAVAVWFFWFRESDKQAVIRTFNGILDNVSKNDGEGAISMAAKHQSLGNQLADTVHIESLHPGIDGTFSNSELLSHYMTIRSYCRSLRLSATGVDVTFPQQDTARLTCYGTARAVSRYGDAIEESRPAICTFIRVKDHWLLSDITEHKVFK